MKRIVFVLMICLLLALSCATTAKNLKFGNEQIAVDNAVPDFVEWRGQFVVVHQGENFALILWEGVNPKNQSEFVLVMVAVERKGDDKEIFMIAVRHVMLDKNGNAEIKDYSDQRYFKSGISSGKLTLSGHPDFPKLIAMKESKKVAI